MDKADRDPHWACTRPRVSRECDVLARGPLVAAHGGRPQIPNQANPLVRKCRSTQFVRTGTYCSLCAIHLYIDDDSDGDDDDDDADNDDNDDSAIDVVDEVSSGYHPLIPKAQ